MDDLNNQATLDALRNSSKDVRGSVLEVVTEFEWMIDVYIANHFTGKVNNDKFNDFISLIVAPHITFGNKIEIFKALVNRDNPEFKIKNPNFYKDFLVIIQERNVFAHYPLHTMPNAINKFITEKELEYLKFKPTVTKVTKELNLLTMRVFKQEEVNSLIKMIVSYTNEILNLIEK